MCNRVYLIKANRGGSPACTDPPQPCGLVEATGPAPCTKFIKSKSEKTYRLPKQRHQHKKKTTNSPEVLSQFRTRGEHPLFQLFAIGKRGDGQRGQLANQPRVEVGQSFTGKCKREGINSDMRLTQNLGIMVQKITLIQLGTVKLTG